MLEDKNFWNALSNGGTGSQEENGEAEIDITLDPDYRVEEKPTETDPPKERTFDIDAILADIHKQAASKARDVSDTPPSSATYRKPAPKVKASETDSAAPTGRSASNRAVTPPNSTPPAPPSNAPPGDTPADDNQVMREMIAAMRELTDELRQFRAQMEEHPYDIASYPRGRPNIRGEPEEVEEKPKEKKKGNKAVSIISNILFYVVIVAIVLGAFLLRSTSKGRPFMLAGYSMANVLTSSMEDVYPKGSLIITKSVDAKELKVGDDITFMVNENTSFTHRIIGITENYQGTGERAFETKGTTNKNPDKEMVVAANVVGKVVFHSKALGNIANFMKANWIFVIFVLVVIMALIFVLKRIFREESPPQKAEKPDKINVNTGKN